MELNKKVIVLTGASGGIGQALSVQLESAGATLILVGRNREKLHQLENKLQGKHIVVAEDIASEEGREALYKVCRSLETGIDLLINNAGVSELNLLEDQSDVARLININLTAPIVLCQKLLPLLKEKNIALVVNIGSTFGSIGYPGFSPYCASKFGLRGFSQALGRELGDSSVGVLYVAPRATRTTINDDRVVAMNKVLGNAMDDVEWVATQVVAAILKNRSDEFYLGWPEKLFVKLNALIPALIGQSLAKQLKVIRRFCQQKP